ncbi:hypothetical protein Mycch_0159 [Mycolicibacterium chubuense NBB4]|uniref:DUF305 domain-containing protein n=1 Tax=Mycolicibacterium chubuense (strain NBB4) TaxID=710421 RepID=I4BCH8_MYCCN|nr:DUF305 domain-containing protein [Mycolicibacterium chubuense]AFM14985.1 hypothetical protein Mycch_0159 [Mycolicibacterium chubuense NBB4]
MRSITTRLAAALTALVATGLLAACGGPESSTGNDRSSQSDTPVITGQPAGYNAEDVAFAGNMVAHHQQAVDMAALVPERSTDPDLVALASRITAAQQAEINTLNVFLVQWKENPEAGTGGRGGHGQPMQGMVDDATMAKLKSLRGTQFDTLWLQSMINHHQGAIEMAEAEIANGANVDAVSMAKAMVTTQENEIGQMKKMLEGATP